MTLGRGMVGFRKRSTMKKHKKKISPTKRFAKRLFKRPSKRLHPLYIDSIADLKRVWQYAYSLNDFPNKKVYPQNTLVYINALIKCHRRLVLKSIDRVVFLLALRRIWRFGPTTAIRKCALDTRLTYLTLDSSKT